MKNLLVGLSSLLIIVCAVLVINFLLKPQNNYEFITTTTKAYNEFTIFNYGKHFTTYVLEDKDFSYTFDNNIISLENKVLQVGHKKIENVERVYNYFAIYDSYFVVIGYVVDDKNYVLNYNFNTEEEEILTDYKGMLIDFKEGITFEDVGFLVNYSFIKNNTYIKDKKNVCEEEKKDMTVLRTVEYYYDLNAKFIKESEELYSNNMYGYIQKYNLCK